MLWRNIRLVRCLLIALVQESDETDLVMTLYGERSNRVLVLLFIVIIGRSATCESFYIWAGSVTVLLMRDAYPCGSI